MLDLDSNSEIRSGLGETVVRPLLFSSQAKGLALKPLTQLAFLGSYFKYCSPLIAELP